MWRLFCQYLGGKSSLLVCWLLKWTTHWLLNENYYSGFLFLCLLLLRFYLLVVSPLFSFQSMQHISGHAGLSHKRECLFKAQQETWITISLHSGSWEKLSSNHEEVKISPKYKTCKLTGCKPMRLAHVKPDIKDMNAYLIYTTYSSRHAVEYHTE